MDTGMDMGTAMFNTVTIIDMAAVATTRVAAIAGTANLRSAGR